MTEWRTIKEFPNYKVSNDGRVLSTNYNIDKELKQSVTKGYFCVGLHRDNQSKMVKVHRLVASAFLSNPNNLPTVDHIDRNRLNNNVCNLRWATHELQTKNRNMKNISMPVVAIKNGKKEFYISQIECARRIEANSTNVGACIKHPNYTIKGYKIRKITVRE